MGSFTNSAIPSTVVYAQDVAKKISFMMGEYIGLIMYDTLKGIFCYQQILVTWRLKNFIPGYV